MSGRLQHSDTAVKFWIGTLSKRISGVWKVWGKNGQVYATSQSTCGKLKLSIHTANSNHEDGINQFGIEKDYRKTLEIDGRLNTRGFVRWKRATTQDRNSVPIANLQFPTEFLEKSTGIGRIGTPSQCYGIEPAPPGQCVEIEFHSAFHFEKNSQSVSLQVTKY